MPQEIIIISLLQKYGDLEKGVKIRSYNSNYIFTIFELVQMDKIRSLREFHFDFGVKFQEEER